MGVSSVSYTTLLLPILEAKYDCPTLLRFPLSMTIIFYIWFLVSPPRGAGQQIQSRLIECPPPRKSLVKGERFIRSEGRPEWNDHFLSGASPYTSSSCVALVGLLSTI